MGSFFRDTSQGYGWASILAHWITAVIIIAMLFFGDSIGVAGEKMLVKHIWLGLLAYPLLWFRVIFRFVNGHPQRLPAQKNKIIYSLAVFVHYLTIVALGVLLVSGPLMAMSGRGYQIAIFKYLHLPETLSHWMTYHTIHAYAAATVAIAIALHIGGVLKHVIWDRDGTLEKMIFPAVSSSEELSEKPSEEKNGK